MRTKLGNEICLWSGGSVNCEACLLLFCSQQTIIGSRISWTIVHAFIMTVQEGQSLWYNSGSLAELRQPTLLLFCVRVSISLLLYCFWSIVLVKKLGIRIWHSEDRSSWYIRITEAKKMHYFSALFLYTTLHVSDRLTVHHQETLHCIHSNWHLSYYLCLLSQPR